ncbi:MAG: isochorismatase family protein [Planctomycetes bacterium]|nr:isochorismatase family protein [Planctomycetota bacterium]
MTVDALFDALDLDADGRLSRADLGAAARRLGWDWPEAQLYAVLDFLTSRAPLPRDAFGAALERMARDPHGPFGEVLRGVAPESVLRRAAFFPNEPEEDGLASLARSVEESAGHERVSRDQAALLLIDPQVSFTRGAWMRSIGAEAEAEVLPLRRAFANCARLLGSRAPPTEVMFTRCPFPPDSYEWDEAVARVLCSDQSYFVKPGNSVLWPPTNGFAEWVEGLLRRGRQTLVLGGCTLNSCVRVSAIDVLRCFGESGLRMVVDLSLCGARASNYARSAAFGGRSPVASAVAEMTSRGVTVAGRVLWE